MIGRVVRKAEQCSHGDICINGKNTVYIEVKLDTQAHKNDRLFVQIMECRNSNVKLLEQDYFILYGPKKKAVTE